MSHYSLTFPRMFTHKNYMVFQDFLLILWNEIYRNQSIGILSVMREFVSSPSGPMTPLCWFPAIEPDPSRQPHLTPAPCAAPSLCCPVAEHSSQEVSPLPGEWQGTLLRTQLRETCSSIPCFEVTPEMLWCGVFTWKGLKWDRRSNVCFHLVYF